MESWKRTLAAFGGALLKRVRLRIGRDDNDPSEATAPEPFTPAANDAHWHDRGKTVVKLDPGFVAGRRHRTGKSDR